MNYCKQRPLTFQRSTGRLYLHQKVIKQVIQSCYSSREVQERMESLRRNVGEFLRKQDKSMQSLVQTM
ncbi:Bgt-5437 [Blumeria graminis f. sp. tritici]|uniref:Bgt-5437 n=1 Tax=Blumeria graminis f. sp. tritici TaxID=62690 RepID=A0A9X9LB90_BLUGR|nr:Bgt-5437 [Blumeria graminis f. sp. tritici]